jgi:hypothetical protein
MTIESQPTFTLGLEIFGKFKMTCPLGFGSLPTASRSSVPQAEKTPVIAPKPIAHAAHWQSLRIEARSMRLLGLVALASIATQQLLEHSPDAYKPELKNQIIILSLGGLFGILFTTLALIKKNPANVHTEKRSD